MVALRGYSMRLKQVIAVGSLAASIFGMVTSAQAKPNLEAVLSCDAQQHTVIGFGRGETLHMVGSTTNYVVTYAQIQQTGQVLIDIKGQRGKKDIVTCTAQSPLSSNIFTFHGFFTPRGEPHQPEL
jgi:hypothetical protein